MAKESNLIYGLIIPTVLGTVCCVLVGLLWKVFDPHILLYAFIVNGFVGSLFFFILKSGRVRDGFAMLFVTWLLQAVLLTKAFRSLPWFLVDLLFFAIVPLAVYVFFYACSQRRRWAGLWSPLTLGVLVAGATVPVTIVAAYLEWPGVNQWRFDVGLSQLALLGKWFALGVGLGAGVVLAEIQLVRELLNKSEG